MTEQVLEQVEAAPATTAGTVPIALPGRPHSLRLETSLLWRLTQVAADFATVALSGAVSYALYLRSGFGMGHYAPELYLGIHLVLAAMVVFALHGSGAYRGTFGLLRIESVRRILSAVTVGIAFLLGLSFFLHMPSFSRISVLVLAPTAAVALIGQRFVLWRLQEKARAVSGRLTPVLIYGAGETGKVLAQNLLADHALGLKAVGFLDDREELQGDRVRVGPGVHGEKLFVLGSEPEMIDVVRRTGAAAVILAMPSASSHRIASLVGRLEGHGIPFFSVPSVGDLFASTLRFGQIGGMPVFTRRRVEALRLYEAVKRAIDLAVSGCALALTAPVLALGALIVKLNSPGPVLFTQERVGRHGRPFTIYKLRTMHVHAPKYGYHPDSEEDPRVFAAGKWLRRFSVDELPQLWNVLRGEMSLVGPRPEMPFIVAGYGEIERQRLTVKPGITGLWQISADRAFRIHDNMHYDLYYVERRCLSLDLAILLTTPFVLMSRRNGAK